MGVKWLWFVVLALGAVMAEPLSEELFFRSPRMFYLEDYDKCLFQNGTYCMGVFEITPEEGGKQIYQEMMKVSEDIFRFNRSLIHRGVCLSWCDLEESNPVSKFERCVDQSLETEHKLRARLLTLNYCKSKANTGTRPIDFTDWLVAAIIGLILLFNIIGSVYDYKKDPTVKPNKFLMAWSIQQNWSKLTAVFNGDQKLDALAPIHGIKAHMIILVILCHSVFGMSMVYIYDERDMDDISSDVVGSITTNGTIVVQTFTMISSFLLGYVVLINFNKAKKTPSIKYWPLIVFNRFMRMAPAMMLVVGFTATWMARLAQGPMWYLAEEMESACRKKWWSQLLFINNIVSPDDRCLVQSWFFAVEMQLFLVSVALSLVLAARPRYALQTISALYVLSLAVIFSLNVSWKMGPVVKFATINHVRTMAAGVDSYTWMFSATWTSLPSTLHGLYLAFLKYCLEKTGFKPEKHKWIGKILRLMGILMPLWWLSGHVVKKIDDPIWLAFFATFDRTIWNIMVTYCVFAFLHGYGGPVLNYLRWSGFQILGRVVFSAMLIHWHFNLGGPAASPIPIDFTIYNSFVNFVFGTVASFVLAVPMYLMVELPMQKMIS